MGYSTDFSGSFKVTPPLSERDRAYLVKFSESRRMKRDPDKITADPQKDGFETWGIEGEFYADDEHQDSIVNANRQSRTQPCLWCEWAPNEDGTAIEWNEAEKFYDYVEWIEYLTAAILAPRGYALNGKVRWQGERMADTGMITIEDNVVSTRDIEWSDLSRAEISADGAKNKIIRVGEDDYEVPSAPLRVVELAEQEEYAAVFRRPDGSFVALDGACIYTSERMVLIRRALEKSHDYVFEIGVNLAFKIYLRCLSGDAQLDSSAEILWDSAKD